MPATRPKRNTGPSASASRIQSRIATGRNPDYTDVDAAAALEMLSVGEPMRPSIAGLRRNVRDEKAESDVSDPSQPASRPGATTDTAKGGAKNKASAEESGKAARLKPLDIVVPDEIGRYTIGHRIGSGTCGVVHLSLDNVLGREVAVKLSPIGSTEISSGKVPGAQRAYQTEIVAAGKLRHPNIVTVYDAGQFEELNFLVMEAVEGESLKAYGKGQELLPANQALRVIIDCCHALDYSHEQDILHRDIKPANIMLDHTGAAKLLDYGIAVGLSDESSLERQGPTLGTPNYMSPEQILGRELTPASDFYSLATVLFELLSGRQLFKARKVKDLFRTVVNQPAPRLDEVKPEMPAALADVIAKALSKKPDDRYQSGADMAAKLEPFVESFRIIEERPAAQRRFIRQLTGQAFFQGFSEVEVAQLLELVKVRTFNAGDDLLPNANQERSLLVITDGMVQVSEKGDLVCVLGEGDCVGELGFIHGTPESRSQIALTPVHVLNLSANALSELPPKTHLHYYHAISALLSKRLASAGHLQIDLTL